MLVVRKDRSQTLSGRSKKVEVVRFPHAVCNVDFTCPERKRLEKEKRDNDDDMEKMKGDVAAKKNHEHSDGSDNQFCTIKMNESFLFNSLANFCCFRRD